MKTYSPASVVLDEYTDEALTEERFFAGEAAKTLLRVPAEYRQSVEAEVSARAYRITWRHTVGGLSESVMEPIAGHHETRCQVVAEVLQQLHAGAAS